MTASYPNKSTETSRGMGLAQRRGAMVVFDAVSRRLIQMGIDPQSLESDSAWLSKNESTCGVKAELFGETYDVNDIIENLSSEVKDFDVNFSIRVIKVGDEIFLRGCNKYYGDFIARAAWGDACLEDNYYTGSLDDLPLTRVGEQEFQSRFGQALIAHTRVNRKLLRGQGVKATAGRVRRSPFTYLVAAVVGLIVFARVSDSQQEKTDQQPSDNTPTQMMSIPLSD